MFYVFIYTIFLFCVNYVCFVLKAGQHVPHKLQYYEETASLIFQLSIHEVFAEDEEVLEACQKRKKHQVLWSIVSIFKRSLNWTKHISEEVRSLVKINFLFYLKSFLKKVTRVQVGIIKGLC